MHPSRVGRISACLVLAVATCAVAGGAALAGEPPSTRIVSSLGITGGSVREIPSPEAVLRAAVQGALDGGPLHDSLLVANFGRVGLDPLSEAQRAGIRADFPRFAPLLIRSQGPVHRLAWDVQLLVMELASPAEQAAMVGELRRWFTEDVREAPWEWGSRAESPEGIHEAVVLCRVAAAEMLAEYGDTTMAPRIREWTAKEVMEPQDRERVIQAVARLYDPCHRRWLASVAHDQVQPCGDPEGGPITVRACRLDGDARFCGDPIPAAAARALRQVLRLVPVRRVRTLSRSDIFLAVTDARGGDCQLMPAADGRSVTLYESDMQEYGFAWQADSAELAAWVTGWLKTAPR
jgi:hypothetical protein